MRAIGFNKYKDRWVLASAEKVAGGGTLDAPPVRVIEHGDIERLRTTIEELLTEPVPVVPQPDYNDRRFIVGIRAEAVGVKSWRAFVKDARCFNLERHEDKLVLEEWPKQGGSFSGASEWHREFPVDGLEHLVKYLVEYTEPVGQKRVAARKTTSRSRRS
jgi:hypothetical protein